MTISSLRDAARTMRGANAMQVLEQSVVVFSQNYLSLCRINIKRAIVLLLTDKAQPLGFTTEGGWRVHSPNLVIDVLKHIRLTVTSNERMWKIPPVNRREVLRRDDHSCQYCGSSKHLTLLSCDAAIKRQFSHLG